MIPHGAGEQRGSKAAVHGHAQIHPYLSALAIHAVALHAVLALKQLGASFGVAWNHGRQSGHRARKRQNANAQSSHHLSASSHLWSRLIIPGVDPEPTSVRVL